MQKITNKIARDAASFEETALREAEAGAEVIRDDYKSKADYAVAVIADKCKKNVERTISRAESSAELVKRNGVLAAKSAILDEAFHIAAERIISSDDAQYLELMTAIAVRAAENEGVIIMNKDDAKKFGKKLVEKVTAAVPNSKFILSNEYANITGGFILRYGDIDVNCSIEAIVASMRPKLEAESLKILFQ